MCKNPILEMSPKVHCT